MSPSLASHTTARPDDVGSNNMVTVRLVEEIGRATFDGVSHQRFLSVDKIKELSTPRIIQNVFDESSVCATKVENLTQYVLNQPAKKLFLLLVLCEKIDWMTVLETELHKFNDLDLPIDLRYKSNTSTHSSREHTKEEIEQQRWPAEFTSSASRTRGSLEFFQWWFQAPVFTKSKFYYEFDERTPMPFIKEYDATNQGSFGCVREVIIHQSHQNVIQHVSYRSPSLRLLLELTTRLELTDLNQTSGEDLRIALKEMYPSSPEHFDREMRVLERIQKIVLANPGLQVVTPVACYRRKGSNKGFFMFPWAKEGNLKQLWDKAENRDGAILSDPPRTGLLLWALEQMRGLCEALVQLHLGRPDQSGSPGETTHCRHGDLKPENILVFPEHNTNVLKIADFGVGKFHIKSTESRRRGNEYTKTTAGTARYMPPEFNAHITNIISRRHDVWSLGCLFMEFTIWIAWGLQGLNQFFQLDIQEFWQERHGSERTVHDSVKEWIRNISSVLTPGTALGDLIRLVDSQMLKPLHGRSASKYVCDRLKAIVLRAHDDEAYCLSPEQLLKIRGHSLPTSVPGPRSSGQ